MKKKADEPRSFDEFIEGEKSRPVPDIPYFARKGGLSPTASTFPYELSSDWFDHVRGSSNHTATVSEFAREGIGKVFSDLASFQEQAAQKGVTVTDKSLLEHFRLGFIAGPIPSGSRNEAAQEAFQQILSRWPQLAQWPPKRITRKGRPKDAIRELRLAVVREADRNGTATIEAVALLFDQKRIGLPLTWKMKGWTWTQAAESRGKLRVKVQKEISNLRRSIKQSSR